ncbi:hypothetical protein ccbrp13_56200 [Ktedonobacteria bacterium brp13]|nr:hypothetical protein ccbrp13_56200 [Ktedonobacteria bacterium brp13]
MTEKEAISLAQYIKEDSRIKATVTGNKKWAVQVELQRYNLKHVVHSTREWNDFKAAWSIFGR